MDWKIKTSFIDHRSALECNKAPCTFHYPKKLIFPKTRMDSTSPSFWAEQLQSTSAKGAEKRRLLKLATQSIDKVKFKDDLQMLQIWFSLIDLERWVYAREGKVKDAISLYSLTVEAVFL